MSDSKVTTTTSKQMRAARARGQSQTDWARVRKQAHADAQAKAMDKKIGEIIVRKRGRPVVGEPKQAISLRLPQSVLKSWKATGAGWQTRMAEALAKTARKLAA